MKNIFFLFPMLVFTNVTAQKIDSSKIIQGNHQQFVEKYPATPDETWETLFIDVQLKNILGDNKTFVDAAPKYKPVIIL